MLKLLLIASIVAVGLQGGVYDSAGTLPGANVQSFTAGAGSYTWRKPNGVALCYVMVFSAGGGGGSGGFSTSDSGGGGGQGGGVVMSWLPAASLASTVAVTLGSGGAGGIRKAVAGDGNVGSNDGTVTSFGAYAALDPTGNGGSGGNTINGPAGAVLPLVSYTTFVGEHGAVGIAGNTGDDNTNVADATIPQMAAQPISLIYFYPTQGGAGAGGLNGGVNFTTGGGAGALRNGMGVQVRAPVAGGATDGAPGQTSYDGGSTFSAPAAGPIYIAGGGGGTGGAGGFAALTDGGSGGKGGNCGGGGGGGGASTSGALGSGAGGDGGAGCVFVICF